MKAGICADRHQAGKTTSSNDDPRCLEAVRICTCTNLLREPVISSRLTRQGIRTEIYRKVIVCFALQFSHENKRLSTNTCSVYNIFIDTASEFGIGEEKRTMKEIYRDEG